MDGRQQALRLGYERFWFVSTADAAFGKGQEVDYVTVLEDEMINYMFKKFNADNCF